MELDTITVDDAIHFMQTLPDNSIDCICTDLPYQVTACAWDEIIPFEPMWTAVKRVLKPRGAFVTTASQPFTSKLIMSNLDWFRYEWIWDKVLPVGHLNAKRIPLKQHENILVFSAETPVYFPQMGARLKKRVDKGTGRVFGIEDSPYGKYADISGEYDTYYPKTIIEFSNAVQSDKVHATQKPVALYEYLIRTYTQPGEIVLDFCCGSGTTPLAARNTGRHWLACDLSPEYVQIALDRLAQPYTPQLFADAPAAASTVNEQPALL